MNKYEVEARRTALFAEADSLLKKAIEITQNPNATTQQLKESDALIARGSSLKNEARSLKSQEERVARLDVALESVGLPKVPKPTEEQRTKSEELASFRNYIRTGEVRTYSAITSDAAGAYVVPQEFYGHLLTGISQYTDLMNPANVRLIELETGRPMKLPQIDLSTITSAIIGQGVDALPVANPTTSSLLLGGYSYRTNPCAATFEVEQDSFESITAVLTEAFSTGLARGIGADLVNGSGTGAPKGILTAASNSGVVSSTRGMFGHSELQQIYFSVNRAWRVSPRCAWLMNDAIYQSTLALSDTAGRPLINITEDGERLFGKKILISPDMPTSNGSKAIAFGDFGQYVVKVAKNGVMVRRNMEAAGYIEKGIALYTAFMRIDASLNAVGSASPVVYGTLAS